MEQFKKIPFDFSLQTILNKWAVVVAPLTERLLLTPEVLGSNPLIGKHCIEH